MAEEYTGEAYCVKCKEKREFTGHVEEKNSRRFAMGIARCAAPRSPASCARPVWRRRPPLRKLVATSFCKARTPGDMPAVSGPYVRLPWGYEHALGFGAPGSGDNPFDMNAFGQALQQLG